MNVDIFMQFYKDKFHFPNVAQRELNCDHIENKIYDINITLFFIKPFSFSKWRKKWVKTFFYCVCFFLSVSMKHVDGQSIFMWISLQLFFGLNFSIKID